jgi:hypothetical protein
MIVACKRIARDYPNGSLVVVGLALVILPELQSRAVLYSYQGVHHLNWSLHPVIAKTIELWWAAEHTTPFMVAAISATVIGAIMVLFGAFRWVRRFARK